jgi:hypothetical protein
MLPGSTDRRPHAPHRAMRVLVAALALSPLLALGVASLAATAKRWENPHGDFREDCAMCHKAEAWLPAQVGRGFDHGKYGFPLEGAHAAVKCLACHATLEFKQHAMNCASCHEDPHRGEMGPDCSRCHSARSFLDQAALRRMHQTTRFPLTGGHAGLECESCHAPVASGHMQFVGTQADCYGCHADLYRATKQPDHSSFPTDCAQCHSPIDWHASRFDHQKTRFPLTGAHRAVACTTCHADGVYAGKSTLCYSCHRAEYDATAAPVPPHAASGFPTTCQTCHTTTTWSGSIFDHASTPFPLTGAHTTVACAGCHGDGVYAGKSTLCYSCHQAEYAATTTPAHAASGFPTACQACHSTSTWAGATFDHNATLFPLTGAHAAVACAGCHADGVYVGKSTACSSCHMTDYTNAVDPNHPGAGISTACQTCHNTTAWAGARVNHDTPYFKIYSGRHVGLWTRCADCHNVPTSYAQYNCLLACHAKSSTDGNHSGVSGYQYLSSACYSCHRNV